MGLIARYFLWSLVIHVVTAFQVWPWQFFWGLVQWPYLFYRYLCLPVGVYRALVILGVDNMQHMWEHNTLPEPPRWFRHKFLALKTEAIND
jgi:hypothetical protein